MKVISTNCSSGGCRLHVASRLYSPARAGFPAVGFDEELNPVQEQVSANGRRMSLPATSSTNVDSFSRVVCHDQQGPGYDRKSHGSDQQNAATAPF